MSVAAAETPPERVDRLYAAVRAVARFWLWFFFKAVDVRHAERVPPAGAVLLAINHPNNLIDSLVVGAVLRRKVHYLATATLFRNRLLARFLLACGAIPVYRRKDQPDGATSTEDPTATFAAVHEAFEQGRLVAIYPEGTTHAEARVQRIRPGAARMALAFEAARPGALALVPVGLSFEARKSFRGRVLVSFGAPVHVSAYLRAYRTAPPTAVDALTDALQAAMEAQVVNAERIDDTRLVAAVEDLYRADLVRLVSESQGLDPGAVDPVRLSRSIVDAVAWFRTREPERVERLWHRIQAYRALLAEYRVRDEAVRGWLQRRPRRQRMQHGWEAVVGLPVFVYGALVNGLPYWLPRWLSRRMARKETDYATIRLLASIVAFPLFWGLETWLVARWTSLAWAAAFAVSLPLSGLLAYRYLVGVHRFRGAVRFLALDLRQRHAVGRLVEERREILDELDRARHEYLGATKGSTF
jgi:glycerol-3-phosphate O-acyltransferase / dihydroxyacetone phosphate acyltransferase